MQATLQFEKANLFLRMAFPIENVNLSNKFFPLQQLSTPTLASFNNQVLSHSLGSKFFSLQGCQLFSPLTED